LLDCSSISGFNFDMEILSFGIGSAPGAKNAQPTLPAFRSSPAACLLVAATIVNTITRREQRATAHRQVFTIACNGVHVSV